MIRVKTKHASYVVDRAGNRWMRISATHPRPDDGEWVAGGFTLGEVGQSCFAHFASARDRDDPLGRRTSSVIEIEDDEAPSNARQEERDD